MRSNRDVLSEYENIMFERHKGQFFLWWFRGKIWPSPVEVQVYAQSLTKDSKLSLNFLEAMRRCIENFRSHLVDAAKSIIADAYSLIHLNVNSRSKRVKKLLDSGSLEYLAKEGTTALFTHPAISKVLIRQYWNSRKGRGIKNPDLIKELNPGILAWAATCIWIALKSWEDGTYKQNVSFKTIDGRGLFENLYKNIIGRSSEKLVTYHQRLVQAQIDTLITEPAGAKAPRNFIPVSKNEEAELDLLLT